MVSKKTYGWLLLLILVIALAGCAGAQPAAQPPAAQPAATEAPVVQEAATQEMPATEEAAPTKEMAATEEAAAMAEGNLIPEGPATGKLEVFSGVCRYPARVKCATLAWHAFEAALADEKEAVSTE